MQKEAVGFRKRDWKKIVWDLLRNQKKEIGKEEKNMEKRGRIGRREKECGEYGEEKIGRMWRRGKKGVWLSYTGSKWSTESSNADFPVELMIKLSTTNACNGSLKNQQISNTFNLQNQNKTFKTANSIPHQKIHIF